MVFPLFLAPSSKSVITLASIQAESSRFNGTFIFLSLLIRRLSFNTFLEHYQFIRIGFLSDLRCQAAGRYRFVRQITDVVIALSTNGVVLVLKTDSYGPLSGFESGNTSEAKSCHVPPHSAIQLRTSLQLLCGTAGTSGANL